MKVKVVNEFHEAQDFSVVRKVGDVYECPSERAIFLVSRGVVVEYVEPTQHQPTIRKGRASRKSNTDE